MIQISSHGSAYCLLVVASYNCRLTFKANSVPEIFSLGICPMKGTCPSNGCLISLMEECCIWDSRIAWPLRYPSIDLQWGSPKRMHWIGRGDKEACQQTNRTALARSNQGLNHDPHWESGRLTVMWDRLVLGQQGTVTEPQGPRETEETVLMLGLMTEQFKGTHRGEAEKGCWITKYSASSLR